MQDPAEFARTVESWPEKPDGYYGFSRAEEADEDALVAESRWREWLQRRGFLNRKPRDKSYYRWVNGRARRRKALPGHRCRRNCDCPRCVRGRRLADVKARIADRVDREDAPC